MIDEKQYNINVFYGTHLQGMTHREFDRLRAYAFKRKRPFILIQGSGCRVRIAKKATMQLISLPAEIYRQYLRGK